MAKTRVPLPPEQDNIFNELILPVCALDWENRYHLLGTTSVIGITVDGREALLLSAKHTFDHIYRMDQPYANLDSRPFRVERKVRTLKQTTMHSFIRRGRNVYGLLIGPVWCSESGDIALALAKFQSHVPLEVKFRHRVGIDTSPITMGMGKLHLVGYATMDNKQDTNPDGTPGARGFINLAHGVYECRVQEVFHDKGPFGEPDPCFRINTPINSGMSGAPVFKDHDIGTSVICGVAGRDGSYEVGSEATGSGETALAWQLRGALGIMIRVADDHGRIEEKAFLDLIKSGFVEDFGGAARYASIVEHDDGGRTVYWAEQLAKRYGLSDGREFEIPEDWLTEAGFVGFTPKSIAYSPATLDKGSTAGMTIELVELGSIQPPQREPGVPGLHRDRTVSLLRAYVEDAEIEPVLVRPIQGAYRYRVADGFHRYHTAVAAGYTHLPVCISPDWT